MTVIEKVARAMAKSFGLNPDLIWQPNDEQSSPMVRYVWQRYEGAARAAIQALADNVSTDMFIAAACKNNGASIEREAIRAALLAALEET